MARDSKGRFVSKRRRNMDGFVDSTGFHPIRRSKGYSYRKAGEGKSIARSLHRIRHAGKH